MIDVRKLGMLAALDRLGTVAAVAEELHLTSPGVSMQLSSLEREVGVRLTQRTGRRLTLTSAGRVLAAHGHDIVDRISLAEYELDALRAGTVGRYRLTAFPSAARTIVADALRRIRGDGPAAWDLHVTTDEPEGALVALVTGTADLAIVHSYSNVPRDLPVGITAEHVATEPVWLAVPGELSSRHGTVRLEDYADRDWTLSPAGLTCAEMVQRACGRAGFRPRVMSESVDFAVQLEFVAAGVGVALVPDLTIGHLPDGVALHALADPVERRIFVAGRAPGHADAGAQRLREMLADSARTVVHSRERNAP